MSQKGNKEGNIMVAVQNAKEALETLESLVDELQQSGNVRNTPVLNRIKIKDLTRDEALRNMRWRLDNAERHNPSRKWQRYVFRAAQDIAEWNATHDCEEPIGIQDLNQWMSDRHT